MYWLMKSEPGECSFEYVCGLPEHKVSWWGIRNYQARNFMRDKMTVGDAVTRIDPIPLSVLRATPELEGMLVLSRGNRLSITPVEEHHWRYIMDHLVKNARNVA